MYNLRVTVFSLHKQCVSWLARWKSKIRSWFAWFNLSPPLKHPNTVFTPSTDCQTVHTFSSHYTLALPLKARPKKLLLSAELLCHKQFLHSCSLTSHVSQSVHRRQGCLRRTNNPLIKATTQHGRLSGLISSGFTWNGNGRRVTTRQGMLMLMLILILLVK